MTDIDFEELTELVVKYQNGDCAVFEQIYNMTFRTAKFTALKILNNNETDADDVLQDCYLKVMEKIDTLQNPASFMGWFNMMIANRAKSVIRKNNPHFYEKNKNEDYSTLDDEWSKEFDYDNNDDYSVGESKKQKYLDETSTEDYDEFLPGSDIEKEELCKTVMGMIDDLTEEKKTAVILYYYNKMTTREISESIGVSENTIKSRLVQAKKDLTKSVSAYEAKKGKLLGVSPIALVVWVLGQSSTTVSIIPFAASGLAVAGTAAAVGTAAAGTGIAAKIIAGVVVAGIVAGGGIAGSKAIKNHIAQQEETTTAITEEYTEEYADALAMADESSTITHAELITSRPIEEYTVPEKKSAELYNESGTLKYGVDYSIQRFAYKNSDGVDVYSSRPVLNRKNFSATYDDLLPAAEENIDKYGDYISASITAINNKRISNGQNSLAVDDTLTEQANVRAEEIAWTALDNDLRYDDSNYTALFDYNGYTAGSREEIRAFNYSSYESALNSVMNDKSLLSGEYEKIGVGFAQNPENEKLVMVVHLYSPVQGVNEENPSLWDRIDKRKNDIIKELMAYNSQKAEEAFSEAEETNDTPVIGFFENYDDNSDGRWGNVFKSLDEITDWIERMKE